MQGVCHFFHKNAPMMSNYSSRQNTCKNNFLFILTSVPYLCEGDGILKNPFFVIVLGGSQSTDS